MADLPLPEMEWVACEICGGTVAENHVRLQRLVRCLECGMLFVNPRPRLPEIVARYGKEYFCCPQPVRGGYENYLADEKNIRRTFERRLVAVEKRHFRPNTPARDPNTGAEPRVLDIGCASGFFLDVAGRHGWAVAGLEPCAEVAEAARARGHDVTVGTVESMDFSARPFDWITLWDVIEHLAHPKSSLQQVRGWLRTGGLLTLTTPDAGSILAHLLRSRWLGFRSLDEHLYFFSQATMTRMLRDAGFEVISIGHTGKYLALGRIIERLRYYTRIGAWLLRSAEGRGMPNSIYLNPFDTLIVTARKIPGKPCAQAPGLLRQAAY